MKKKKSQPVDRSMFDKKYQKMTVKAEPSVSSTRDKGLFEALKSANQRTVTPNRGRVTRGMADRRAITDSWEN